MIAAFMAPYGPAAKSISRPDTLAIVTIAAASLRSRYGMAAFTKRTVPIRSTSKLARQFAASSGIASALTLATTMSRPPSSAALPSTHRRMPASSATSTARPTATLPRPVSASAVAVTSRAVRAQNPTAAPSAASASTIARPIPLVPPVTRARSPFRPRSTSCLLAVIAPSPPRFPDGALPDAVTRPALHRASGLPAGRGSGLAQMGVHAAVGVRTGQESLGHLGHGAVVGVHDVGQRGLADLGQELVGVQLVEPVQLAEPGHHAGLAGPPGVLQRPGRAHDRQVAVGLDPRPGRRAALDQVHDQRDVHRALHRGAARLALALPVVPVAHGEQRARHVDPQVAGRPGPHLRG